MKIGDLVKVKDNQRNYQGQIGVIAEDIFNKGKGFRVLFSDGRLVAKLKINLELIKTDKNCP